MATPFLRPLGFGEILDGTFALYRRHFVQLVLIGLIPAIPAMIGAGLLFSATLATPAESHELILGLGMALWLIYWTVAGATIWGGLAEAFSRAMMGEPVHWRISLRFGLRRMHRTIGASILAVIGVSAAGLAGVLSAVLLGFILVIVFSAAGISTVAATAIATVFGIGATAVPVGYVMAGTTLYLPAIAAEDARTVASLQRSWTLMDGGRWKAIGLWMVGWIIVFIPAMLLAGFMILVFGISAFATLEGASQINTASQLFNQVSQPVVSALTTPFTVGLLVLLYYDRRVRVEGYDLQLAEAEMQPVSTVGADADSL